MTGAVVEGVPVVLSARGVSVTYRTRPQKVFERPGVVTALSDVDIDVCENETLAIIGDSGSGKTTVTRVLLGLLQPTAGVVRYREGDLSQRSVQRSLRSSSGVIFQNPASSFDPRWSIERSISEPLTGRQHSRAGVTAESVRDQVWEVLREVDLDPEVYEHRFPVDLSGGQMQRAAFARAIVNRPAVLLADEPMSAIDMPTRLMVLNLLRSVQAEANTAGRQMATIVVSHDLGVVQNVADRVVVVHEGHIIESGPTESLLAHPQADYTKTLIAAASL